MRKETIHRNVQVERPKPFRSLPRIKDKISKATKRSRRKRIVITHIEKAAKRWADIEPKNNGHACNYIGCPKVLAAATEAVQ